MVFRMWGCICGSSGSDPGNGLGLLNDDGVAALLALAEEDSDVPIMPLIVTPSSPTQGSLSLLLECREMSDKAAF